jgi:DNA polymerase-3 subunit delta
MSDSPKPVLFILHGDDAHAMRGYVQLMVEKMGDPAMAELNTTRLDGRQMTDEDLHSAVGALPFLTDRRLVILEHPLTRMNSEAARDAFRKLLTGLPPTTALVLVIDDEWAGGREPDWKTIHSTHWLRRWAADDKNKGRAYIQEFRLPGAAEMPGWITARVKKMGGQISPDAARALAGEMGNDTEQASREIEKLLTYVDYRRPVEEEDIALLTAPRGETNIFEMVDAMGMGDVSRAQRVLHQLLDESDPIAIFGMMVRQFRLLLVTREALQEGRPVGEVLVRFDVRSSYQWNKLTQQARRYSSEQLISIYHQLLDMDEQIKTSASADAAVTLETFVAGL